MKRICILVLTALLILVLAGCETAPAEPYTVDVNGQSFTVDPVDSTITDPACNVYTYVIEDNSVTITYPNGAQYWWSNSMGIGYGGLNDDFSDYVDGFVLESVLDSELESREPMNPGALFAALFCFLVGGVNVAFPYAGWYLSHGWRFRDAEPSEAALILGRVSGVLAVIFGIGILFVG